MSTKLTVGIDFYTYDIPLIIQGKEEFIRISIWDFGGQEQFKKLFGYYVNGANGIFLVFDLLNIESLIKLDWWYDRIMDYNLQECPKILVGTKLDLVQLEESQYKVEDLIINQFLKRHEEEDYIRTSSKENTNIIQSFKEIVRKILDSHDFEYDKIL